MFAILNGFAPSFNLCLVLRRHLGDVTTGTSLVLLAAEKQVRERNIRFSSSDEISPGFAMSPFGSRKSSPL